MKPIRVGLASLTSALLVTGVSLTAHTATTSDPAPKPSLVGTWTLHAADEIRPDGARVPSYGPDPRGLLILGQDGRYSAHVFRAERPKFASGDKRQGTAEEYKAAVLGMSSHFGRYVVDSASDTITFHIELASFPDWDGTEQRRPFTLSGDELSYRVPATRDGSVPISVWRRVR